MPTISGNGYISKMGHNRFYMFLVIDGQKVRRPTGTEDADEAAEKLEEWKAQVKVGVIGGDTRLRFEAIRDNYLASGKHVQESVLRDLNEFFKNAYVSAITPTKIKAFREWRENQERVLEYKEEIFQKEFALRQLKAQNGSRKKLAPQQIRKLEVEARKWVENGVKATTNRRLTILRAMFNHAAKEELIPASAVPASFCLWHNVDNVKTNKFTDEQFVALLKELPSNLHPVLHAYQNLGMRTNQLKNLTLNMVDDNLRLVVPGEFTKNGEPFPLPLVDEKDKPYEWSRAIVRMKQNAPNSADPIFDVTNFRKEWRRACHKLKLGIYNEATEAYRGAEPHDFRRTAVSNLIAQGIPESVAMQISGHKTNSMFKRYGITDPRQVQNAFNKMRKAGSKA